MTRSLYQVLLGRPMLPHPLEQAAMQAHRHPQPSIMTHKPSTLSPGP